MFFIRKTVICDIMGLVKRHSKAELQITGILKILDPLIFDYMDAKANANAV